MNQHKWVNGSFVWHNIIIHLRSQTWQRFDRKKPVVMPGLHSNNGSNLAKYRHTAEATGTVLCKGLRKISPHSHNVLYCTHYVGRDCQEGILIVYCHAGQAGTQVQVADSYT